MALGLIDKIVTGPLWRKLQEPSMSVLKLSEVNFEISRKFDQWTLDAQDLVEGTVIMHQTQTSLMQFVSKRSKTAADRNESDTATVQNVAKA